MPPRTTVAEGSRSLELTTCKRCRAVTHADAIKCFRCGTPLYEQQAASGETSDAGAQDDSLPPPPGWAARVAPQAAIGSDRRSRPLLVGIAGWLMIVRGLITLWIWWTVASHQELVPSVDLPILRHAAIVLGVDGVLSVLIGFLVLRLSWIGWILGMIFSVLGVLASLNHLGLGGFPLALIAELFTLFALVRNSLSFLPSRSRGGPTGS